MTMEVTNPQIEIRSLVLSGTDLASYQTTVMREAQERLATRERGLQMAEAECAVAERGIDAAIYADIGPQMELWEQRRHTAEYRIKRRTKQVESAKRFLSLVTDGYLPIPRLPDTNRISWLRDPLPPEVLEVLGHEQIHGRFVEFRVSGMRDKWSRGGQRFDPILIGICDGEMFPLAWWR